MSRDFDGFKPIGDNELEGYRKLCAKNPSNTLVWGNSTVGRIIARLDAIEPHAIAYQESLRWALALVTDWAPTEFYTPADYDKAQKLVGGKPFSEGLEPASPLTILQPGESK